MTTTEAEAPPARPEISWHGKSVILVATAIALLATPLASPAMPEIANVFAQQAETEPFARAIIWLIDFLPGNPDVKFLVKFILLSVPALFIIVSAPLTGWMSDNWGRKSLLNVSLVIFALGGVSGYFADTFLFMFVGRAVLGLSIAGIKTATVAMVGDFFEGEERQKFIGMQGSAMKMGGVVFMLLGGFLANTSWQTPFLGYLISFIVLPSAIYALAESLPARTLASAAADKGPGAAAIPFWPSAFVFVSAFLASGLFFITPVQLPFFLKSTFNATPLQMGAAVAVGNTVGALISLTYYRFKARMNYVAIYAFIFLSMSLGYYALTLAPNYNIALMAMVIGGLGFGLYVPNHSAWILSIVAPERRGFGVGLVTTAMFMGQFSAPILVQPFIVPGDPANVWRNVSAILFVLAVLYAGLSWVYGRYRDAD